ncbi:MAG: tyrosine-protein phosphatase [Sarcina sp.]
MKNFIEVNCVRKNDEFLITIANEGKEFEILYSEKPEISNDMKSLGKFSSSELEIADPILGKRTYFIARMDGFEDEIFAERKLPLKGACNFRDLGGFRTAEEKRVKWDKFYRSDALNVLTQSDIKYLEDLGLKGILDYRATAEAEAEKDLDIKGAEYFNVPAMKLLEEENDSLKGNFNMEFLIKNIDKIPQLSNPVEFMVDGYKAMVFENKAFKKLIELMVENKDVPFVQHCKSGKDRTGVGSALVLLLLGVSLADAKRDYLSSNDYRKEYNDTIRAKFGELMKLERGEEIFSFMMEVKEEYFDAVIEQIMSKYSSLEEYFEKEFGLDGKSIEKLKQEYLY